MKFRKNPVSPYRKIQKKIKNGQLLIIPSDNRVIEDFPPYKASQAKYPAWFRKSPKDGVRKCAGIQDYLSTGVVISAWTDFHFTPTPDGMWNVRHGILDFSRSQISVESFPASSTGRCPMTDIRDGMEDAQYPKLVTPYLFITPPKWSLSITGILHEPNENYDVVPGTVNSDYYHQINIVLNIKTNAPFSIKYGDPIAHLFPVRRDSDIEEILFLDESYYKYASSRGLGIGSLRTRTNESVRFYRKSK